MRRLMPLASQEILKYVAAYFADGWERQHQKCSPRAGESEGLA